jgi:hypothetical protein
MSPTKHSESISIRVLVELSVWARFASEREGALSVYLKPISDKREGGSNIP